MALGHGSKRSVSCDQEVVPSPLNSGVSNCTLLDTLRLMQAKDATRTLQNKTTRQSHRLQFKPFFFTLNYHLQSCF